MMRPRLWAAQSRWLAGGRGRKGLPAQLAMPLPEREPE